MAKKISNNVFIGVILIMVAIIGTLIALRLHTVKNLTNLHKKEQQKKTDSIYYYKLLDSASIALFDEDYDKALNLYKQADSLMTIDSLFISVIARKFIDKKNVVADSLLELDNILRSKMRSLDMVEKQLINSRAEIVDKDQAIEELTATTQQLAQDLEMEAIGRDLMAREKKILEDSIENSSKISAGITFKNRKGLVVEYFGLTKDGKANGYGIGMYETGGVYKGEWKDNSRHGKGKYTWVNGDSYEGQFNQGIRQGYGVYTFKSGERYEGDWENDLRNGKGVYYSSTGKIILQGTWEKDKLIRTKTTIPVF